MDEQVWEVFGILYVSAFSVATKSRTLVCRVLGNSVIHISQLLRALFFV